MPGGAAERAVIASLFVLIARELADLTERGGVEIISVAVEAVFGKIFVVIQPVF